MTNLGNILIVDDTPDNLRLLSTMLIAEGYSVRSVINGKMALMGAKAEPPDLILLDINMPQMNGYEVCEHLKADPLTHEIPVIFISALEDVLDKVRAFSVGGVDYITKPFQVQEVCSRIHTHLHLYRLQKLLQKRNKQLEKAEERFRKAFAVSPNPLAIASLDDGQLLELNPSFLRFSEYSSAELRQQPVQNIWTGKGGEAIASAIAHLRETGAIYNREFELTTKSGEVKVVLLSLEKIELSDLPCVLFMANDITERKRLEHEFISLVSHELRTPLMSVMGSLDLLASQKLVTLTPQADKVLAIAVHNCERLIRLVNDILNLERMKSGQLSLEKATCSGYDLVMSAITTLAPLAEQAQIEIIPQLQPVQLFVDGDRLLQALTNLLNNAIKFSEAGGKIWLSLSLENNQVLIGVKDQGR
jgi:PAS domain S-box-containing protein